MKEETNYQVVHVGNRISDPPTDPSTPTSDKKRSCIVGPTAYDHQIVTCYSH